MIDLRFNFGSFSSASCEVEAVSEKGREFFGQIFGFATVGVTLPKTKGADLEVFARQKGMATEIAA
jgi:hypothetical protein